MSGAPEFDDLFILRANSHHLAKTLGVDGRVVPCGMARRFDCAPGKVTGLGELSRFLSKMEGKPNLALIRGRPRGDARTGVLRNGDTFEDQPLHTVMFDVDGWAPPEGLDPVQDPRASIDGFVKEKLPSVFAGVDYHWQLSASAGTAKAQGKLKAHVWFWLETAYDSATLRAWAEAEALPIDLSVFSPVQLHFTANPILEEGATDPVPVRSGLSACQGGIGAVPLVIDVAALNVRLPAVRDENREPLAPLDDDGAVERAKVCAAERKSATGAAA